jgi:hypothetical protein
MPTTGTCGRGWASGHLGIWAYAEAAPDPGWRLAAVPWDGTQVVADVGCGNGFDLRQLVPGGRCGHAVGIDLTCCQKLQTDHTRRPPKLAPRTEDSAARGQRPEARSHQLLASLPAPAASPAALWQIFAGDQAPTALTTHQG